MLRKQVRFKEGKMEEIMLIWCGFSQRPDQCQAIIIVQGKFVEWMNEWVVSLMPASTGRIFINRAVDRCYMWTKSCVQRHRGRKTMGEGSHRAWTRDFGNPWHTTWVVGTWRRATESSGNALHGQEHSELAVRCMAERFFSIIFVLL